MVWFHFDNCVLNQTDDNGDLEAAGEHYQRCIELRPKEAVYRWNYAILLEHLNKFTLAQEQYEAALQLEPNSADTHYNYGMCVYILFCLLVSFLFGFVF